MELVPFQPSAGAGALVEAGSIPAMVAAQQATLHAQLDQLQRLVVAQCRLTGVNPLAQEMAAGALSIKIGKKPRDLLNPKAVHSMQSLFAVKDTIGKRETREISALCGVTVTQVREFFASQRTRVRKAVRLSREKALKLETSETKETNDSLSETPNSVCSMSTEQTPLNIETDAQVVEPLRTLEPVEMLQSSSQLVDIPQNSVDQAEVQQSTAITTPITPAGTIQPTHPKINPDLVPKEAKQEDVAPGVESEDKKFLDSIFALMRKEQTFSGQVKLMEWILQINNATILSWFLTMGGLTIVSTWLSQAATEEQTTVILVIFKVFLHLPLHKALPAHMSAALQTINRLRFYRTQDISSRARNLLSRLSKVLIRSQASKKPQKDLICKQRISEILRDDSWRSEVDITEEILALTEGASESRKPDSKKTPLLLTASADESYKKSPVQTKSKERRKVLLVEQPNRKAAGKIVHSARSITNNSRPLSADDIQKAKMRAMFMQEKYGKVDTSKVTDKPETAETQKPSGLVNSNVPPMPKSPLASTTKQPVDPSPSTSVQNAVPLADKPEILTSSKLNIALREKSVEKLGSKRVRWQIPPEVWIDPSWSLSAGENSKELDVQTQRNRRENETFYAYVKDIPLNPKDPWDMEMDFDDTLTPEIPIDQPPDVDAMDSDSVGADPPNIGVMGENEQFGSTSSSSLTVPAGANGAASEPDLELLAVLLKNPQLVFALSSNEAGNLPTDQTIALLDMLKQTGLGLSELVNSLSNCAGVSDEPEPGPEIIPTSLPSPTPPKDLPANAGWRSEFPTQASAANLPQTHLLNRGNTPLSSAAHQSFSNVVSPLPSQPYTSVSALPAHIQTSVPSVPQLAVSVNPLTQHAVPVNNHLNRTSVHQHTPSYALSSDPAAVANHQQPVVNKPTHGFQNVTNPTPAHSLRPDPNASYTTRSWQSSAADVASSTVRNTTPDPWAASTFNSFNDASAAHLNRGVASDYNSESMPTTYDAYGSTPVSSQGLGRNGYTQMSEYQKSRPVVSQQRHSLSPEPGSARVYGGTQGYIPSPSKLRNYGQQSYNPVAARDRSSGQQSYNPVAARDMSSGQQSYTPAEPSRQQNYPPAEPSRQWSSGQQSYTPAEPSRQWSSGQPSYTSAEYSRQQSYTSAEPSRQQSYTPAEPSRQWSSGQQSYTPAEPSKQWSSAQQGYTPPDPSRQCSSGLPSYTPSDPSRPWNSVNQVQNPDTSRQWTTGKQDSYNPSDGQNTYDQRRRRRWE